MYACTYVEPIDGCVCIYIYNETYIYIYRGPTLGYLARLATPHPELDCWRQRTPSSRPCISTRRAKRRFVGQRTMWSGRAHETIPGPPRTYYLGTGAFKGPLRTYYLGTWGAREWLFKHFWFWVFAFWKSPIFEDSGPQYHSG